MLRLIDMMHIAIFTALMAVLGFMPPLFLSFTPVPITLQTLVSCWQAGILRPKSAFLSQLVFLLLVAFGAPLLPGGRGGFWRFFRAERRLFNRLSSRLMDDQFSRFQTAKGDCIASLFHSYRIRHYLYLSARYTSTSFYDAYCLSQAAFMSLAYVPGDLLKAAVSAFLAIKVTQALSLSDTMFTKGG